MVGHVKYFVVLAIFVSITLVGPSAASDNSVYLYCDYPPSAARLMEMFHLKSVPVRASDECRNMTDCDHFGFSVCKDHKKWAKKCCALYFSASNPSTPCEDMTDCDPYGFSICTYHKKWAEKCCAEYCGFCKPHA